MTFATNFENRSMHDPTAQDIINIKRTLRYLNHTTNLGISYDGEIPFELNVYCDSDFAGGIKTRKKYHRICSLLMWRSHKKQPVIALSSTEAEFIAAADACKEVSYIRSLLEELITDNFDINLYVDNQSTIKIIKSGQSTTKTKHIDVKYHFVKDQAQKFNLIYCPTEHQIADILTKPLARPKFVKFKSLLMTTIQNISQVKNLLNLENNVRTAREQCLNSYRTMVEQLENNGRTAREQCLNSYRTMVEQLENNGRTAENNV
ncbi:hypothetical protein LAZ67_10000504 [Cordylochernes scorpioides]|uniref:Copia protein n=1 Tax=Cordylochernes scorpioides TaxID=51811 RepID=A0ABY6KV55_9ARAC|nr:hypothetical protein LAZ67_10000504 [Cordylochernes scorpioides]